MSNDSVDNFTGNFKLNKKNKNKKRKHKNIHLSKLTEAISLEFSRTFILKCYSDPTQTNRVYWAVAGAIQNKFYEDDIPLDQILSTMDQYLNNKGMIVPPRDQRDTMKLIRDTIHELQVDGLTDIELVNKNVSELGISPEQFEQAIKQLKKQGDIFEPKVGHFKLT